MTTKIFDAVNPTTASVAAAAAGFYPVNMAGASADVVITLPATGVIGQAIGVELSSAHAQYGVTWAGSVVADVPALYSKGDYALFTWDGTTWQVVDYNVAPGWLSTFGGTAVGLYRLQSGTNFVTDYSGNGRTLTSASPVGGVGYSSKGSVKTITAAQLGTVNNAAFRLQGAMSLILFFNSRASADANKVYCACGIAGATQATNVQWSIGTNGSGNFRYFAEEGVSGNDITYLPSLAPLIPGWQVLGFTRSSGQVVRFYGNGQLLATSAALTAPSGGASSVFSIGAYSDGSFVPNADFAQVGVYNTQLTDAQMLAAAQQCLGSQRA